MRGIVDGTRGATWHQQFVFSAWEATPQPMPGSHTHTDIELNLFTGGEATYFLAGRFYTAPAERLLLFWAGLPHRLTAVTPGTRYLCMTLPLAWFLGWGMEGFAARLMAGDWLLCADDDPQRSGDPAQFARWVSDLHTDTTGDGQKIVLLEVEARLRRMARHYDLTTAGPSRPVLLRGVSASIERMTGHIAQNFAAPLALSDIAKSADLHPNYAVAVFKEACGISVWEYVTRFRVSHAQRLLLTTDWTVERIALECGWGSPSRFFAGFKRVCGCTPRAYREGKGRPLP